MLEHPRPWPTAREERLTMKSLPKRRASANTPNNPQSLRFASDDERAGYRGRCDIQSGHAALTTPVAFLSSLPRDIFYISGAGPSIPIPTIDFDFLASLYGYGSMPIDNPSRFVVSSLGPDTDLDTYLDGDASPFALKFYPGYYPELFSVDGIDLDQGAGPANFRYELYDPTNGSISSGDIYRANDAQSL